MRAVKKRKVYLHSDGLDINDTAKYRAKRKIESIEKTPNEVSSITVGIFFYLKNNTKRSGESYE